METNKSPTPNKWISEIEEYQVASTIEDLVEKYSLEKSEIIRLAGNECTLGSSFKAIEAAREASFSSNYYENAHSERLIDSLTNKFKFWGLDMNNLTLTVGNGMDSIIDQIGYLFLNLNTSIIVHKPSFPYYDLMAKRLGSTVISCPEISLEAFTRVVREDTKLIFLCSPNNPTGQIIELDLIEKIASKFPYILIFVDHAYIDFTERNLYDAKTLINKYPNMVIGYTFSKAYALAGFRVGYALMHKELGFEFLKSQTPFLLSKPSMAAALAALEDEDHLKKIIYQNYIGKNFLYQEFTKLGINFYPSEANFILFETKTDSSIINEKLLKKGIIIRRIPSVSNKALRVTIGSLEENQRFINALKECIA